MKGRNSVKTALEAILNKMDLPVPAKLVIEEPKDISYGDLSTNAAMLLAKKAGKSPMALGSIIADQLKSEYPFIAEVNVVKPGFINITLRPEIWQHVVPDVENSGKSYGKSDIGHGEKVLVEYVSANPTGPLHVGHGRGAAVGDSVARILKAAGYTVNTEYYLNDAGRQMRLLGTSIYLRVKELAGEAIEFCKDCYKGEYIIDLAKEVLRKRPGILSLPETEALAICQQYGQNEILAGIKKDLIDFRCSHELFYSEKSLVDSGAVDAAFKKLAETGRSYEKDGALWFNSKSFGDDQDRVLRKSDGTLTYFATDIAYHHDKFMRGYEWLVDVWGADHHGYIPRMRAAVEDMGQNPDQFSVLLIQLVNLFDQGQAVSMSTRAGEFVELAQLIREVGVDAARFMFLSRSSDSPLDFDLELARKRTLDNPVYYVQYAHARVCALQRRAVNRGLKLPEKTDPRLLSLLSTQEDLAILRQISFFENTIASAAKSLAPQYISRYLLDLASRLHTYYAKYTVLMEDNQDLTFARLALLRAAAQTIANGLELLGVSAPETM